LLSLLQWSLQGYSFGERVFFLALYLLFLKNQKLMKKLFFKFLIGAFLCVGALLQSDQDIHFQQLITLSHVEGKGLGYSKGYTSLDMFMGSLLCESEFAPFIDLRGHVFNNGRLAGNAGAGLRWLNIPCRQVWGINAFYDSFSAHRRPYHQVSLGLELLSASFELHLNGYLPVGKKKTQIYLISYDFSKGFLCKVREQFSMGGCDLELGYRFCKMKPLDLYAGLGAYYYRGRSEKTKNAFKETTKQIGGGRFRVSASFMKYVKLEGTVTYDNRFRWGGQGLISFCVPFSPNGCFGNFEESCTCADTIFRPVERNEIIVIDRINRFSNNPEILNPEFEP
jgi:Inverse autotransporter, beta-domain